MKMSILCFICNLPVLSHQASRTWEQGNDGFIFCHDECIRCDTCGISLVAQNISHIRRHNNCFYCELHYSDVVAVETNNFLQQLREFKRHALGSAVARRKSSTTLVFPVPPQACPGSEQCNDYPHQVDFTPGYWTECTRKSPELPPEKYTVDEIHQRLGTFELTSFEQETYEKYFHTTEHWNYFTNDDDLGPVILSLKQEVINNRDQFRILIRTVSYSLHGLVPASSLPADRYNREDVVRSLSNEIDLHPSLQLGQLPSTPDELLKLDQVFIKSELKVGVIYVKEGQNTEEEVLDNNENSKLFEDFLHLIGEEIRLKGFDKYKGGLDAVHDLTGKTSIYTYWRGIEIMFHVSTLLPYENHDPQKLQRKRHIGNDIVCLVFLEAEKTSFNPSCIKSHFLHTFIVVQTNPNNQEDPIIYKVSVVTRDEVGAYKPYLWQKSVFEKGPLFREWILTKIVNGERASYSAPKFARMQDRTRSQLLEDIVTNLQNHVETGQIPKPYRRGSWRPIGHMRPSSPLLDSMRDLFEGYDQLAKDFTKAFKDTNALCDIVFNVGQGKNKVKVYAVRAILAVRSRVFQEMLYGIASGLIGTSQSPLEALNRAVTPTKIAKSSNFLQVPDMYEPRHKSAPSSPMVMRAFSRLARWDWSGKKQENHLLVEPDSLRRWTSDINCNERKDSKQDASLLVPRLSVCADVQKVDRNKLMQSEFNIIEFDADTFETLLEYLHTGSCPLTCRTIPGLICAAEHFDLPELLQACFHHAKQHLRIEIVCVMLSSLENYYWRYTSASELVNMILLFVDTRALQVFDSADFYELSESMVQMILSRELNITEVQKFQTMLDWSRSKVKHTPCRDLNFEFRCTMERLTRDLKLCNISPTDLIKIVLPSKAIRNERILETLMFQANSGMYRIQSSYLQECRKTLQNRRDSRPDMKSFGVSLDRRDSLMTTDSGIQSQHDSLLDEYAASVRRQQSLDHEIPFSIQKTKSKRRSSSSKADIRPLLHRQDTKRRGSKQLEIPMIHQPEDTSIQQDAKASEKVRVPNEQLTTSDDKKKMYEPKLGQKSEQKTQESRLLIWLHRQDSKSSQENVEQIESKSNQWRTLKIHESSKHSRLSRQDSKDVSSISDDSKWKKKETKMLLDPKQSRLHRQHSSYHDEDVIGKERKLSQRRASKSFDSKFYSWLHRQDEGNRSVEESHRPSEIPGPSLEDVETSKQFQRRNSKSQELKLLNWFTKKEFKSQEGETSDTSKTMDLQESGKHENESEHTVGRLTHRRDSKFYNWFFKQSFKSQEEVDRKEKQS